MILFKVALGNMKADIIKYISFGIIMTALFTSFIVAMTCLVYADAGIEDIRAAAGNVFTVSRNDQSIMEREEIDKIAALPIVRELTITRYLYSLKDCMLYIDGNMIVDTPDIFMYGYDSLSGSVKIENLPPLILSEGRYISEKNECIISEVFRNILKRSEINVFLGSEIKIESCIDGSEQVFSVTGFADDLYVKKPLYYGVQIYTDITAAEEYKITQPINYLSDTYMSEGYEALYRLKSYKDIDIFEREINLLNYNDPKTRYDVNFTHSFLNQPFSRMLELKSDYLYFSINIVIFGIISTITAAVNIFMGRTIIENVKSCAELIISIVLESVLLYISVALLGLLAGSLLSIPLTGWLYGMLSPEPLLLYAQTTLTALLSAVVAVLLSVAVGAVCVLRRTRKSLSGAEN